MKLNKTDFDQYLQTNRSTPENPEYYALIEMFHQLHCLVCPSPASSSYLLFLFPLPLPLPLSSLPFSSFKKKKRSIF